MGRVCSCGGGGSGSSRLRRTKSFPTWCVLMRESVLTRSLGFGHGHEHVGVADFAAVLGWRSLVAGLGDCTSQQAEHLQQFFVQNRGLAHVLSSDIYRCDLLPPSPPPGSSAVLLTSCCRYMEALATAYPARFSADCGSLARPVASCALVMTTTVEVHDSEIGVAVLCREAKVEGEENDDGLPSRSGRTITIEERNALELWVEMLGICLLPFCGSGGGSWTTSRSGLAEAASGDDDNSRDPTGEHSDDPFDSDNEEEEDGADDDEEEGSRVSGDGKARSRWVAGWMRRAGVTFAEPLECPFDVRPGGRDEDLPVRLATLISYHAQVSFCFRIFLALFYSLWVRVNGLIMRNPYKGNLRHLLSMLSGPLTVPARPFLCPIPISNSPFHVPPLLQAAASASRPASVSSLATVLAVLVAFTAAEADGQDGRNGTPSESHAAVVEEAFSCLQCLSEAVPESSAQAECVKAALVSLKECAQVRKERWRSTGLAPVVVRFSALDCGSTFSASLIWWIGSFGSGTLVCEFCVYFARWRSVDRFTRLQLAERDGQRDSAKRRFECTSTGKAYRILCLLQSSGVEFFGVSGLSRVSTTSFSPEITRRRRTRRARSYSIRLRVRYECICSCYEGKRSERCVQVTDRLLPVLLYRCGSFVSCSHARLPRRSPRDCSVWSTESRRCCRCWRACLPD